VTEPTGVPVRGDETSTLSYRQMDHWTRLGLLHPQNPAPGSGHRRIWPEDELRVARVIAALRVAGVELPTAHRIARQLEQGGGRTELAPGLVLSLADGERGAA
jgi:DNA-binding transcriptional MerR regulator